jgi:UDP-N-acetylglucosamine--N-acetylmuramyl-(pentapeptide) pyrophosphoryl-undecaprenol N-acetylglucosamine transferase
MSIAELCVVGKPVIFVPYPHAAEDHQTANANELVTKHAAIMINDSDVKDKLISTIASLVNDPEKANALKENIVKLGNTNADELIAHEILKTLNG